MDNNQIISDVMPSKADQVKSKGKVKSTLPIFLFLAFAILIFFVIIPRISSMISKLDEINEFSAELNELNMKIRDFSNINSQETIDLLTTVRVIAPSSNTDITKFQNEIRTAILNVGNITLVNLKIRDDEISNDPNLAGPLQLREVPIDIELVSTKNSLQLFLNNITSGNDFVTVSQMSFKQIEQEQDESWRMNLSLIKSQFVEGTTIINFYSTISPEISINEVIKDKLLQISTIRL